MGSKIIKTFIITFFVGTIAFAAMTFLATDLSAETVYHKKYKVYNSAGEYTGIECHGEGSDCKISIIGGIPYLKPIN